VASRLSTNEGFFRKIEEEIAQGTEKFFLATDDGETRLLFEQKFPGKFISYCSTFNDSQLRQTTVQDALVDLYLLARTNKIIGSFNSSFSIYASDLGGIPLEFA
jgi:hypothetical protein